MAEASSAGKGSCGHCCGMGQRVWAWLLRFLNVSVRGTIRNSVMSRNLPPLPRSPLLWAVIRASDLKIPLKTVQPSTLGAELSKDERCSPERNSQQDLTAAPVPAAWWQVAAVSLWDMGNQGLKGALNTNLCTKQCCCKAVSLWSAS